MRRSDSVGVIGRVVRVLSGRQMAGRGLTVFPDDVFIVSYPRSGNTWTRFLSGNLIGKGDPVTFANLESRIPEIYFNPDWRMRKLRRPRILKSHECFDPRYRGVIYIVRDPRDVAVSYYHHNVKWGNLPENYPMEAFVPRFIAAEFDSRWGSWSEHVTSWLRLREHHQGFLLLRYEELKRETASELARIGNFLRERGFPSLDTSPQAIARAVELSSPQRMRELESLQKREWVLTKDTRIDKPFVRTASSGDWKMSLSSGSVLRIETAWGSMMQELGYELSSVSQPACASK